MKQNKNLYIIFIISFAIFLFNSFLNPHKVTLAAKEKCSFETGKLFKIDIEDPDDRNVEVRRDEKKTLIIPKMPGTSKAQLMLFEHLKLKEIQVDVVEEEKVFVMGNATGLRLYLDGLLVEALTGVDGMDGRKYNPLKDAGVRKGDIILAVDNEIIKRSEDLVRKINKSQGSTIDLKIRRNNEDYNISVCPIKSRDDKFHVGIWVRDTVNGIGTVTFCDRETMQFGALGHGISDENENGTLPICGGEVFSTEIASVKKGVKGIPGELKGNLLMNYNIIGEVNLNTNYGVFGYLDREYINSANKCLLPISYKEYVKEGKAQIFCNVEGDKVNKYDVEIQKIITRPFGAPKGMIVKITDDRLIKITGGIVQGMSGSPIIQNNRIIGAITHVLINDPLKGYGVFIENMFDSAKSKVREIS